MGLPDHAASGWTLSGADGHPVHRGLAIAAVVIVAGWAALVDADPLVLAGNCLLGWVLLALAWIDWHSMRLPDRLTLPLLALGLLLTWLTDRDDLAAHLIGAIAGYASFALIGLSYRYLRGHEGLGRGDAKLLAAGGAWLGWEALPMTVLLATLLGLALALLRQVGGRQVTRRTVMPFGPMLALAIWLIRLYGAPGLG